MKKCLFIALAALGFVACEKDDENSGLNLSGELEQSYVAITLAADDMSTRAGTDPNGVYEDGTQEERHVSSAYVFFFNEKGEAFPCAENNQNFTLAYDEENGFINQPDEERVDNVSDIQNAVLVIQNRKGEHPTKMIAVLNWVPNKNYSISELQSTLANLRNEITNDFVKHFSSFNTVYRLICQQLKIVISFFLCHIKISLCKYCQKYFCHYIT